NFFPPNHCGGTECPKKRKLLKKDEFYRGKALVTCIGARKGPKVSQFTRQARSSGGSSGIWCFRPSERYNVQGIGGGVKEFVQDFGARRNTWNRNGHGPCSEGEGRGQCWSNPHSALGGNWAIHVVPL